MVDYKIEMHGLSLPFSIMKLAKSCGRICKKINNGHKPQHRFLQRQRVKTTLALESSRRRFHPAWTTHRLSLAFCRLHIDIYSFCHIVLRFHKYALLMMYFTRCMGPQLSLFHWKNLCSIIQMKLTGNFMVCSWLSII